MGIKVAKPYRIVTRSRKKVTKLVALHISSRVIPLTCGGVRRARMLSLVGALKRGLWPTTITSSKLLRYNNHTQLATRRDMPSRLRDTLLYLYLLNFKCDK